MIAVIDSHNFNFALAIDFYKALFASKKVDLGLNKGVVTFIL